MALGRVLFVTGGLGGLIGAMGWRAMDRLLVFLGRSLVSLWS